MKQNILFHFKIVEIFGNSSLISLVTPETNSNSNNWISFHPNSISIEFVTFYFNILYIFHEKIVEMFENSYLVSANWNQLQF